MRKRVRLTEGDLRRMVNMSVRRILGEGVIKDKASMKYKDGRLCVYVDRDECTVKWYFVVNGEPDNFGEMEIETYTDGTWLPYTETYGPGRWIPSSIEQQIYKLFKKTGMRDDDWG